MMPLCHFYAQGKCRNGRLCKFSHNGDMIPTNSMSISNTSLTGGSAPKDPHSSEGVAEPCKYFQHGNCRRGNQCFYRHDQAVPISLPTLARDQQQSSPALTPMLPAIDSRSEVTCKFEATVAGCRKSNCPFLHRNGRASGDAAHLYAGKPTTDNEEEEEIDDDFSRDFLGAQIGFDDQGQVREVTFTADFSTAFITGLQAQTTPADLQRLLADYGHQVDVENIQTRPIPFATEGDGWTATVRVQDPSFANRLCHDLLSRGGSLKASVFAQSHARAESRKIHISWHRASRSVWVNYGRADIAYRVAQRFNEGRYKCLDRRAKASVKGSYGRGHNPLAWTVLLSNVPGHATSNQVQQAISYSQDRPRNIEMGPVSYTTSAPEISIEVRKLLESKGPVESFYLNPTTRGNRVKVSAVFVNEADVRSAAAALNNTALKSLGNGKLTVTIIHSARVKVSNNIFTAWQLAIDEEREKWKANHLFVRILKGPTSTSIKVESENAAHIIDARKVLMQISKPIVLKIGTDPLWHPGLNKKSELYTKLKAIESELQVAIQRSKARRRLEFYGSPERLEPTIQRVVALLDEEAEAKVFDIVLDTRQFSAVLHGKLDIIKKAMAEDVTLNIVSKTLTLHGSNETKERVLKMIDSEVIVPPIHQHSSVSATDDCPICFCKPDEAAKFDCGHSYCLKCLEDYSQNAAGASGQSFTVKCQGAAGDCTKIFMLAELKDRISSNAFEVMLEASFEEYVKRHPKDFHHCPTPDCGYVYRCCENGGSGIPSYRCSNCLELVCRSCHASHGAYTCAEYKDIASGGLEALAKLKKELNIKDCPKCATSMEKTEGCNHMTCAGCNAHICWVCLAVFDSSGPCYKHMREVHGSIGLDDGVYAPW